MNDDEFIATLRSLAGNAGFIITVCTGSILLSRTGILNGRYATPNKRLFAWTKITPGVNWVQKARWVKDGLISTSSGVSAGTGMALGFVADLRGYPAAKQLKQEREYAWNDDPGYGPFSRRYQ